MSSYNLIGLMSGTSMDGLDIVNMRFVYSIDNEWSFKIECSSTVKYNELLLEKLKRSKQLSAIELLILDKELGFFYSTQVNQFIKHNQLKTVEIDAICSHGHTIFHQPEKGFTYQIGCGQTLAYQTGIKVINDFRQKDIVAGGQGAPLVPIGDKLLFMNNADALLNIGGFANVCYPGKITRAYDVCPGNLPLNHFAEKLGYEFDLNGELGRNGNFIQELFDQLGKIPYYNQKGPKSLGTEWLESDFMTQINDQINPNDAIRTLVEHIANEISKDLNNNNAKSVFITGGGAKNKFLIDRIKSHYNGTIHIPDDQLIDYKEALIFAFLGALYLQNTPNSISTVTGAKKDTIGGILHLPN